MTALWAALSPAITSAQQGSPTEPYDGHLPFNCLLQDVGTGTAFPNPESDPFCVEFDKTEQNVTDLGLIDFTSREPDRTAAAGPKCFYFQRDHWTASVVQGTQPEVYHWDGSYWFDKATGDGGVHVENFRQGGQAGDASAFVPPEYKPYFGAGGGGVLIANNVPADPSCATKVDTPQKHKRVYAHELAAGLVFRKKIQPFKLGTARTAIVEAEGLPYLTTDGTDRFKVTGGGQLRIAYRGGGNAARAAAMLTTAPKDGYGHVHVGDAAKGTRRALHARRAFKLGSFTVLEAPRHKRSRFFIGVAGGKVAWIAIVDPTQIRRRKGVKSALGSLAFGQTLRVDSAGMPY